MSDTTTQQQPKVLRMTLIGLDGNAFSVMGTFRRNARRQGWPEEAITAVLDEATAGDYDHLLATILRYIDDSQGVEDYEGNGDDDDQSY